MAELSDVVNTVSDLDIKHHISKSFSVFDILIDQAHKQYSDVFNESDVASFKLKYPALLLLKYVVQSNESDNRFYYSNTPKLKEKEFIQNFRGYLLKNHKQIITEFTQNKDFAHSVFGNLMDFEKSIDGYSLEKQCNVHDPGIVTYLRNALVKQIPLEEITKAIKQGLEIYESSHDDAKFREYFAIRNSLMKLNK